MGEAIPSKLCGRPFSRAELETIRGKILTANPPLRSEIARQVCETLEWSDVLGRPILRPETSGRPAVTSLRAGQRSHARQLQ